MIPIPLSFPSSDSPLPTISPDAFDLDRHAFMLFTSGSTGQPKGVPITHASLASQCASMSEVWGWSDKDRILHVVSRSIFSAGMGFPDMRSFALRSDFFLAADASHPWGRQRSAHLALERRNLRVHGEVFCPARTSALYWVVLLPPLTCAN